MTSRLNRISWVETARTGVLAAWLAAGLTGAAGAAASAPRQETQFGYTRSLVRNANENDFRSAMRAYTLLFAGDTDIRPSPDHRVFESAEDMREAITRASVDFVGGSAAEIMALPDGLLEPPYFATRTGGVLGAEYVLLVNIDSAIQRLAELAGKRLLLLDNVNGSLIRPWLGQLLRASDLPGPADFFLELKPAAKPALAALPVFFGQADACVITVASFATLTELNPQISRRLRVIARSPALLPILSGFRRGFEPALRESISRSMLSADTKPAGRQILLLFQTEQLALCSEADLAATRDLLAGRPVAATALPSPPAAPP